MHVHAGVSAYRETNDMDISCRGPRMLLITLHQQGPTRGEGSDPNRPVCLEKLQNALFTSFTHSSL